MAKSLRVTLVRSGINRDDRLNSLDDFGLAVEDDLDHARGQLPDSGDRRPQVHDRQAETSHDLHLQVRAEVEEWLASHGRRAEIVMAEGRPEQEILRIAHDRNVALIAIGDLTSPGPRRLPPVAEKPAVLPAEGR